MVGHFKLLSGIHRTRQKNEKKKKSRGWIPLVQTLSTRAEEWQQDGGAEHKHKIQQATQQIVKNRPHSVATPTTNPVQNTDDILLQRSYL